ncbi:hypothetical protein AB1Y20_016521 [Prymnesium parvum]|uniref:Cyclic nucleotide-binding domain-containing protein n=1 Tax=Prymnesium parvum TaxID=97485 RepID=A0AB34IA12_PRYPA
MGACSSSSATPIEAKSKRLEASPLGVFMSHDEAEQLSRLCDTKPIAVDAPLPLAPFYCVSKGALRLQFDQLSGVTTKKGVEAFFTLPVGPVIAGCKDATITEGDQGHYIGDAPGECVTITAENLEKFLGELSATSREALAPILCTSVAEHLKGIGLIQEADLAPTDLKLLAELCSYESYNVDEYIFKAGDPADRFFFIVKGSVSVIFHEQSLFGRKMSHDDRASAVAGSRRVSDNPPPPPAGKTTVNRKVGDSFGIAALAYNFTHRKYAYARACEPTLLLAMSKENFETFCNYKPGMEDAIYTSMKRFLLQSYKSMNTPLLADLTDEKLQVAGRLAKLHRFVEGETIYNQGDPADSFYVVLHGKVKMEDDLSAVGPVSNGQPTEMDNVITYLKEHGVEVLALGAGGYFGEVGMLIPGTKRFQSCKAVESSTLLRFLASDFQELFGDDRMMRARMEIRLLRDGCTLKAVLDVPSARALFEQQLATEYAQESILFYDQSNELLRQLEQKEQVDAHAKFHELTKNFIMNRATHQVNIPSKLQQEWMAADSSLGSESSSTLPAHVIATIQAAVQEIYELMARDTFMRFKREAAWQDFLRDMGPYSRPQKHEAPSG